MNFTSFLSCNSRINNKIYMDYMDLYDMKIKKNKIIALKYRQDQHENLDIYNIFSINIKYIVSWQDLENFKKYLNCNYPHPLISFGTFFSCSSRINEVHIIWYGMYIKKNKDVVSDFSIRIEGGGVFSYMDYMESPYSSIWNKGVVT